MDDTSVVCDPAGPASGYLHADAHKVPSQNRDWAPYNRACC